MRENPFIAWLKAKSEAKGLIIPKKTSQIFTSDRIHLPNKLLDLAKEVVELGERDGELGIQALLLRLKGAERINQQYIPYVHSALDLVVSSLGYDSRNELIEFFAVPDFDKRNRLKYDPSIDLTFDDKLSDAYSKVLKTIQQLRPNIPVTLPRIAELVKTPKQYVEGILKAILEQKPILGEYLDLEQVFILKEDTEEIIDELIINPIPRYGQFHCPNCQEIIKNRSATACPSCGKAVPRCIVCKLPISSEDSVGKCSECEGLAHLNHLQEWVKTQGKCPRCQQATEIITVREAKPTQEEKLAFGINLSNIKIINSGEWKDVPEGTKIDLQGFFNMLSANDEKKLYLWHKGGNYSIGFFEQGKFFIHEIKPFDSVKDYLIALNFGFTSPAELQRHREARKHGWENFTVARMVCEGIDRRYRGIPIKMSHSGGESTYSYNPFIRDHPIIKEKYSDVLALASKKGFKYEMLPPFDSDVFFGEDWFVWFLAYNNNWKSFGELYSFAKVVFPEFEEKYKKWVGEGKEEKVVKAAIKYGYDYQLQGWNTSKSSTAKQRANDEKQYLEERNDRFLKLVYLAVYGPFKVGDDWLQGWPSFDALMSFWTNLDELRIIFESRDEFLYPLRTRIESELLPMKAFPSVLPYDTFCITAFDWVVKAAELAKWSPIEIETIKEQKDNYYRKP